MAVQNFKCPNCGGQLQMDDGLEKGFCMYCGSEIHIKEEIMKIQIEHSGKIEIDDSKKLANSIELADRAFSSGNYNECYNYCCAVLECDLYNSHAIFRKGLCAAYISHMRINELEQALTASLGIVRKNSQNIHKDLNCIFLDLLGYVRSAYALNCKRQKNFNYPSLAAANNTFAMIASLTKLCASCADIISVEMINENPIFEKNKRECLEQGLKLCEAGMSSLRYFSGYRTERKGDTYVQEEVYESVKSPIYGMMNSFQSKFKNDFNNLPSTQKSLARFDNEINALQKEIDAFNQALEGYFVQNPEIGKVYKRNIWPFFTLACVSFSCAVVGLSYVINSSGIFDIILSIIVMSGFISLAAFLLIKIFRIRKKKKEILENLPIHLLNMKNIHDQSRNKKKSLEQTKATFIKKNIKE